MRFRAALVVPVLATLFLVAGCGGGGNNNNNNNNNSSTPSAGTPTLGTLLGDMVSASKNQHSAHYSMDLTASFDGKSSNPKLQLFLSKPIKLHLDGDASKSAFTANGTLSALGVQYSGKLLADASSLYVNLLGNWYGSKTLGLDKLKTYGSSTPGTSQVKTKDLLQHVNEVVTGTVTDGPLLDGTDTWEFKGKPNADGIAKLSAAKGKPLTASQKNTLKVIQDSVNLTLDVGKSDHLVRNVDFGLDLTADQLKTLSQTSGSTSTSSLSGLTAVHFSLTIGLSKWGESVSITPPASYQPFSALVKSLAGLAVGSANGY